MEGKRDGWIDGLVNEWMKRWMLGECINEFNV